MACGRDERFTGQAIVMSAHGLNGLLAVHRCDKKPTLEQPNTEALAVGPALPAWIRQSAGPAPRSPPTTPEGWLRELDRRAANDPAANFGTTILGLFQDMMKNQGRFSQLQVDKVVQREVQAGIEAGRFKGLEQGRAEGYTKGLDEGKVLGAEAQRKASERRRMMNPEGEDSEDSTTKRFALLEID